jgi:osmotically-inducible protein OsmY
MKKMKKIIPFLIGSLLVFGTAACQNPSRTTSSAPDNTENQASQESPSPDQVEENKEDAQSEVRRDQLNSDIRSREERNNATGGDTERAEGDLESEVRSKLEANLPKSQLAVEAEDDGSVKISGTVVEQAQLDKIESLAKEIKGVKNVVVDATVAQPTSSN